MNDFLHEFNVKLNLLFPYIIIIQIIAPTRNREKREEKIEWALSRIFCKDASNKNKNKNIKTIKFEI